MLRMNLNCVSLVQVGLGYFLLGLSSRAALDTASVYLAMLKLERFQNMDNMTHFKLCVAGMQHSARTDHIQR